MSDWIKTKAMDLFFNRIGAAAKGTGTCAQFTTFKVGYGWVDESGETPELSALVGDETDIPAEFFVGSVTGGQMTVDYSIGVITCQCTIPVDSLVAPEKASVIGIFDQDDGLIAAAVFYPDWVLPEEEYRLNVYLNFPTSGVA